MNLERCRSGLARVFVLALVIVIWASVAAADGPPDDFQDHPRWPETRVAELARQLLQIINAKDAEAARRFVHEHYDPVAWRDFPADQNAAWLAGLAAEKDSLAFHGVRTYTETLPDGMIIVIVRDRVSQSWRGMSLTLDTKPPGKIRGMTIMPARPPSNVPSEWTALTPAGLAQKLDSDLEGMTADARFSGVVLLARDGDVLFRKAYGKASRRFNVPNRVDTKFNLGSMNKMFTAVAVMQLVEQGKLDLDVTVDRYLPDGWLATSLARRITVRQLITHTSGLGDYLESLWDHSRLLYRDLDDYRPLLSDVELQFDPGTRWAYSNTGFLLLGVIIESVSGKSYHDHVRSQVFAPAGMTDTDCYEMDLPVPNLAIGYTRDADEQGAPWRENTLLHVVKGGPAGGGYSTVDDLLRFARALQGGLLLNDESRRLAWTATEASLERWPYGYGFDIRGREGSRSVGHAGSFPGISADLGMWLDSGWTVVVLSNIDGGAQLARQKIDHGIARIPSIAP